MANCVMRSLNDLLFSNLSDNDIRESKVQAVVIAKDNNSDVKVTDGNTTATISFAPNTNKRFANVAVVDAKITFFKLQKQSAQTLIFTKASYLMVEKGKQKQLCLQDLVGKKKDDIVHGELVVKVWDISNAIQTASGNHFRKIKLGDDKFTVDLTLWNQDVSVVAFLRPGMAIAIKNFSMDGFTSKTEGQPLNLCYRSHRQPLTSLKTVRDVDVAPHLKYLDFESNTLEIKGIVNTIDDVVTFNVCPGKPGIKCGKKVRDGALFCEKPSCRAKVNKVALLQDYYINMSVLSNDGKMHVVRCFKENINKFEKEHSNVERRLQHLIGGMVHILATQAKGILAREALVKEITFPE